MSASETSSEKLASGCVLLDWVRGRNARILQEGDCWRVVCLKTGATMGEGATPLDAVIAAARNE